MNLTPAYKHKASYLVSHLPAPQKYNPVRHFICLIWCVFVSSACYVLLI